MSREIEFRIALIVVALVHLALSRRQLCGEGSVRAAFGPRAEGVALAAGAGISLLIFAASAMLRLVNPDWVPWFELPLSNGLRWLGFPIMAIGAALHLWGTRHLGENLTLTISTVQNPLLVTTGPYQWVRHPLYTGGMLESLGACLLLASGIVTAGAVSFWLLVIIRTSREEALLRESFGAEYVRYAERVGRFLPRRFHPDR